MSEIGSISTTTTISSSTKKKLESLGVSSSSVTSESEAQSIIDQLKAAKKSLESKSTDSTDAAAVSSSEATLLSQAKSLASQVGASVSSDDSINDIISKISAKIRELSSSENSMDRELAQRYQTQLSQISTQSQNIQTSQQSMYSAMDMISANNKLSLNL